MNPKSVKPILFFVLLSILGTFVQANIFVVVNTDNTGAGSLRNAITDANGTAQKDTIQFQIADNGTNVFEGTFPQRYALITVSSSLPVITNPLFIDGSTQFNTNTGVMAGRVVGVDNILQPNIPYPDVYIVPNYTMPNSTAGTTGNGLSVNSVDVKIQGFAISGFGNRNTNQATAVGHADISVLRGAAVRNLDVDILHCFLSSDPLGNYPSTTMRRSKSGGILVLGNNYYGTIRENYVSHSGGYGIVFHSHIDNSTTSSNLRSSRHWIIKDNQIINIGRSTTYTGGRAADGISLLNTLYVKVETNYVADFEQIGIDLGHNTDNNLIVNNTVTGLIKEIGSLPVAGIRIGFSSQTDTLSKNKVYDNPGSLLRGGIYLDRSNTVPSSFPDAVIKDNRDHLIIENECFNNTGSGIVLSSNGAGGLYNVTISRNSTYDNTDLGIDLNYNNLSGPAVVSVNDDMDLDAGTNNVQNFPIIDSSKFDGSYIYIWGKGPAGSTIEFFVGDGGTNMAGGRTLNYGEGKTFIGSGIDDGVDDGVVGVTGSYNIDGNIATNNVNLFQFVFPFSGQLSDLEILTSTATVGANTSEFGPVNFILGVLGCNLINFSAVTSDKTILQWKSLCDQSFSHFEIERSIDGQHFGKLSTIVNYTQSPQAGIFSFTDYKELKGIAYYRLRLVNKDGSVKYSNTLQVASKMSSGSRVYPNPLTDQINIQFNVLTEQMVTLKILDHAGRMVSSRKLLSKNGINTYTISLNKTWPPGNYIVQIIADGSTSTHTIVKQ